MSFIGKHVINYDERLIYIARVHWIYMFLGALWWTMLAVAGFFFEQYMWDYHFQIRLNSNPVLEQSVNTLFEYPLPFFIFSMIGFWIFCVYSFKMLTTEIVLSDTRLIYKRGWLNVEVEEIEFSEILGEHIYHGFIGKIFGCGRIKLDSRFIGDMNLPYVTFPHKLLRALHKARAKMQDPLSQVGAYQKPRDQVATEKNEAA